MSKVDVMFPFHGDVEMMKRAARSVMGQQFQDWRLVVLDDASPGTAAADWFAENEDPRVVYLRNEENLGANGNYSKALTLAEADITVIMGADDVMLPNYLGTIVDVFEAFPHAAAVQPGVQVIDGTGRLATTLTDTVKRLAMPRVRRTVQLQGEPLAVSLSRAPWHYFPAIAWKTSTITRIGFRPDLNVVQDLALLLDIAAEGGSFVLCHELAFLYRRHKSSDSSVRAVDGRRFREEKRFYTAEALRFADMGWTKAAAAADRHLSSRLHAATLLAASIATLDLRRTPSLIHHVFGQSAPLAEAVQPSTPKEQK